MRLRTPVTCLLLPVLAVGCTLPQYVEPVEMPGSRTALGAGEGLDPTVDQDSPAGRVDVFSALVAAKCDEAGSIACLPLASLDRDHEGPWVSQLGTALADELAAGLIAAGFRGRTLDSSAVGLRLAESNLQRSTLSTLERVAEHGDRLGADVVTFGVVRRDDDVGRPGRDVLVVDLQAYDLAQGRVVLQDSFEIPSDVRQNRQLWRLAKAESPWQAGSAWDVPMAEPSLDRELAVLCELLARRSLETLDGEDVRGTVYVPPLDTGSYVREIADLRAAQATFGAEYNRRLDQAVASGEPLDTTTPVTLHGQRFENLQAAQAYLTELQEVLSASEVSRFVQTVSSLLGEELRPALAPHEVRVNELGSTKWADTQLVQGELALGGLARSPLARGAMRDAGVSHVVAPRVERIGDAYVLRVEVHDLAQDALISSTHARIAGAFTDELAAMLDEPATGAPAGDA